MSTRRITVLIRLGTLLVAALVVLGIGSRLWDNQMPLALLAYGVCAVLLFAVSVLGAGHRDHGPDLEKAAVEAAVPEHGRFTMARNTRRALLLLMFGVLILVGNEAVSRLFPRRWGGPTSIGGGLVDLIAYVIGIVALAALFLALRDNRKVQ